MLDQTGARDGPPALSNLQIADLLGGAASAAIALLAALVGAQRTGRGRYIDVAMADASLAHNIFALHALEQWGRVLPRGADLLTGGVPCYGVYPTQDGRWLAVGALEEKFWQALCATIDAARSRRHAPFALGDEGARVRRELERVFAARAARALDGNASRPSTAASRRSRTLDEALADPQFAAREMVRDAPRRLARVRAAVQALGPRVRGRRGDAPAQGEHSAEVLREAGYDDAAIDRRARRAIGAVRQDSSLTLAVPTRASFRRLRRARADGQRGDARVLGIVEAAAGGDVVGGHRRRVGAPEELVADRERRHAEHAARDRLVGVAAQLVLHLRRRRSARRRRARRGRATSSAHSIGRSGRRPSRQTKRKIRCTASGVAVAGDREAQQRQRIERMLGRELERDAELPSPARRRSDR